MLHCILLRAKNLPGRSAGRAHPKLDDGGWVLLVVCVEGAQEPGASASSNYEGRMLSKRARGCQALLRCQAHGGAYRPFLPNSGARILVNAVKKRQRSRNAPKIDKRYATRGDRRGRRRDRAVPGRRPGGGPPG